MAMHCARLTVLVGDGLAWLCTSLVTASLTRQTRGRAGGGRGLVGSVPRGLDYPEAWLHEGSITPPLAT